MHGLLLELMRMDITIAVNVETTVAAKIGPIAGDRLGLRFHPDISSVLA
jgi:hypothetical protein